MARYVVGPGFGETTTLIRLTWNVIVPSPCSSMYAAAAVEASAIAIASAVDAPALSSSANAWASPSNEGSG